MFVCVNCLFVLLTFCYHLWRIKMFIRMAHEFHWSWVTSVTFVQSRKQFIYYVTYCLIICVWNPDLLLDCASWTFEPLACSWTSCGMGVHWESSSNGGILWKVCYSIKEEIVRRIFLFRWSLRLSTVGIDSLQMNGIVAVIYLRVGNYWVNSLWVNCSLVK